MILYFIVINSALIGWYVENFLEGKNYNLSMFLSQYIENYVIKFG